MAEYEVMHCTVNDGVALADCKTSAFGSEDWWLVEFADRRPNALRNAMAQRMPHNMLQKREVHRHQLVRHVPSGQVVGYARWILPVEAANEWLEAQFPDVSAEDRAKFAEIHKETVWKFDESLPETDNHVHAWRVGLSPPGPHFRTWNSARNPLSQSQWNFLTCL